MNAIITQILYQSSGIQRVKEMSLVTFGVALIVAKLTDQSRGEIGTVPCLLVTLRKN